MSTGKESCPLCGALPCDWVDDPHMARDILIMTLAKIREVTGVGIKPMLSELPEAIRLAFANAPTPSDREGHGTERPRTSASNPGMNQLFPGGKEKR